MSESQNQDFIKLFDQLNSVIEDKTLKQKILKFLNNVIKHLKAAVLCIKISDIEDESQVTSLEHDLKNTQTMNSAEI